MSAAAISRRSRLPRTEQCAAGSGCPCSAARRRLVPDLAFSLADRAQERRTVTDCERNTAVITALDDRYPWLTSSH